MIGMPYPILPIETKKTLKDVTQNVLNTLFVPIPEDENIQLRTCQVYGIPGTGKSSLYRWFGFKGLKHYKKDNINLMESTNLDALLDSIEPVPVNFLFLEDAGLETQSACKELIAKFTRIRHTHGDVLEDKGKERRGIDDLFFNVQDPFLLAKKLRSTLHVELWKNAPTNDYDKGVLIKNIGMVAVKQLELINKRVFQQHKYQYLSHCVARAIDSVGYFKYEFIPSKESVLKRIESALSVDMKIIGGFLVEEETKIDSDFLTKLKNFTVKIAERKKKTKPWYYDALYMYFIDPQKPTWKTVTKFVNNKYEKNLKIDTIISLTNQLFAELDNDAKGDILELTLLAYLNKEAKKLDLQQTFCRFSRSQRDVNDKLPDLLLADTAVNAKLFFEDDRPSWTVSCIPEYDYPDPWVAFYSQDKKLCFYHNKEQEQKPTLRFGQGRNVVSVEDFLAHVKEYYSTSIKCPECGTPMATEDYNFYRCGNCPTTYVPDGSIFLDEEDKNDS